MVVDPKQLPQYQYQKRRDPPPKKKQSVLFGYDGRCVVSGCISDMTVTFWYSPRTSKILNQKSHGVVDASDVFGFVFVKRSEFSGWFKAVQVYVSNLEDHHRTWISG